MPKKKTSPAPTSLKAWTRQTELLLVRESKKELESDEDLDSFVLDGLEKDDDNLDRSA